jgi:hypothetical protein
MTEQTDAEQEEVEEIAIEETKMDGAWRAFFRKTETLGRIARDGYAYVTADELKEKGGREPRLMAKQDTLVQRPKVFREQDLTIFPVTNGKYIIFKDKTKKSYFEFPLAAVNAPVRAYESNIDLTEFDTYPRDEKYSESQAIDFAFISSLLRTVCHEEQMHLVLRGRLGSHRFDFMLPDLAYQVYVSGVQIEIDSCYESSSSIYLIEAKNGRRKNFHIRQLYYPYLEWSHRSQKRVVPIFLVYTNGKYYFHEFAFSDQFGEMELTRTLCYTVNQSPVSEINLPTLLGSIAVGTEPVDIPFPQADDLDKVVDVVSLLNESPATKQTIAQAFEMAERQGDYYGNAARYLGFAEKNGGEFAITPLGRSLLETTNLPRRTNLIVRQLIGRPTFRKAVERLAANEFDVKAITNDEVSEMISKDSDLNDTTPTRRAITVRGWLRWLLRNGKFL